MWETGLHFKNNTPNINDQLLEIEGNLRDKEAHISLVEFLKNNPTFAANLLLGVELYEFQHMMIKAMFQRDNYLAVCSRGLSKSWTAAVFCVLYAAFNQGVKIAIVSKTFRQARMIFKQIEDFSNEKGGEFFKECIAGRPRHNADAWEMNIGSSLIVALPLGDGGKIRGYRFNVMVIDELLLLSDQIINEVLKPFLVVNIDPKMKAKTDEAVAALVETGEIKEEERYLYESTRPKVIGLTSASYTFEYLYELYEEYIYKITNIKDKKGELLTGVSHCVMQMAYAMAPKGLYNEEMINELKSTMSEAQLQRELGAQFTDDSSGYFSSKKMKECTVPSGEFPTTKVMGNPDKEYILAIDPNYSDSESSDHFAMCVLELNEESRTYTLVHAYAMSKSNLGARAHYVKYLLDYFNIVYIIVDSAGGDKFIQDIMELPVFENSKTRLKTFEADFENDDYAKGVALSKQDYDPKEGKIVHSQVFQSRWIRLANEHLQAAIDRKRLWFASSPQDIETEFNKQRTCKIPIENLEFESEMIPVKEGRQAEFVDHQAYLVELTKVECALIEVRSTPTGNQTFDLPQNLRKSTSPDKARKDSYTVLLLANWAAKCYFDMKEAQVKKIRGGFIPMMGG